MQKIQTLRGTPGPTFMVTTADLARFFARHQIYKTNLHTNGDFEATTDWDDYGTPTVNTRSTVKVITGDYSRILTPNAANEGMQSEVFTTIAKERYYHSVRVYPDDGSVVSVIVLRGDGTTLATKTFTGLTENAWNLVEIEVTEVTSGALAQVIWHSGAQTSGDFYFADSYGSKLNGTGAILARKASGAQLRLEDNDIRYAFGGTVPTMAATGKLGHLIADPASIVLDNFDAIKHFRYVSNVTGTAGILNVTMEF